MSLQLEDFPTDRDKVRFLISLLSGSAVCWAMLLLTQPNPLLDDYAEFCHKVRTMFEDPVHTQMANKRLRDLRDLRQGQGSLTDYIADFWMVTQDLQWNEAVLMDQF